MPRHKLDNLSIIWAILVGVPSRLRVQMRISTLTFLFLLSLFPTMLRAQGKAGDLNPAQKLGQRVFQQRCGVCHTKVNAAAPMYGINLYKDIVDGNEDMIREYIRNGSN